MNGSTYPSEEDALLSRRQLSTTAGNRFHVSKAWIHSIFIGTIVLGLLLSALFDDRSFSAVQKSSSYVDHAVVDILDQNSDQKQSDTKSTTIRPGSIFLDTNGDPINAHGGGFLFHENIYYWYGEIKIGKTYTPPANVNWGGSRVDLVGISCYSSQDLIHWESRGIVLPAVTDDPSHDLYVKGVAERPKVVYNSLANKFVMWLHIDSMDYKRARSGVAESDSPVGPFTYIQSFRPNDQMARDLTLFVDNKSTTAYLITSSEDNAVMHINELTSNYTSFTGKWKPIFQGRYMEAPTIFQRGEKYYFIGSGCTAWKPNAARSAVSTSSIWGPWTELGNPCRGEDADTTFHSQSTYVLPISDGKGGEERFMFAADRWNEKNLSDSRYVWLPIEFGAAEDEGNGGEEGPMIHWQDGWDVSKAWN
mmetsp:Transcript_1529/g.2712  ORF Transcript_1529/g.2712 Transcript_1529/m.2712 type:complete len:420 (-) Transcript_1529:1535-2794(-)